MERGNLKGFATLGFGSLYVCLMLLWSLESMSVSVDLLLVCALFSVCYINLLAFSVIPKILSRSKFRH